MTVRVLVVHHQIVFAEALAGRLAREPDVDVVGAVARPARALALVPSARVDVVLLDWALADGGSRSLVATLAALEPRPALVVLGDDPRPVALVDALRAGVRAWVSQDSSVELLLDALRSAATGRAWLPPALLGPVLDHLLERAATARPDALAVLTRRERDVLTCMMAGMDQTAIGERLFLSPNTVRTHRRRVLAKLRVHSSLEAVSVARRAGLAPAD